MFLNNILMSIRLLMNYEHIPPHNLHSVHHDFNIRKPLCRTNIFENDCFTVASLHGIVLPSFIINSKSVASFNGSLVSVDLSKFLVYAV